MRFRLSYAPNHFFVVPRSCIRFPTVKQFYIIKQDTLKEVFFDGASRKQQPVIIPPDALFERAIFTSLKLILKQPSYNKRTKFLQQFQEYEMLAKFYFSCYIFQMKAFLIIQLPCVFTDDRSKIVALERWEMQSRQCHS